MSSPYPFDGICKIYIIARRKFEKFYYLEFLPLLDCNNEFLSDFMRPRCDADQTPGKYLDIDFFF